MNDLFAGYAIPGEEASVILRDSVDDLIRHCHRTDRPRQLYLQLLEDHCAAYAEAQKAEETDADE